MDKISFNDAIDLSFIGDSPENATTYIELCANIPEFAEWSEDFWTLCKNMYFYTIPKPSSDWLQDIFINKCQGEHIRAYKFLKELCIEFSIFFD